MLTSALEWGELLTLPEKLYDAVARAKGNKTRCQEIAERVKRLEPKLVQIGSSPAEIKEFANGGGNTNQFLLLAANENT